MRRLIAACVLAAAACGSRSGVKEAAATETGKGTPMTTQNSATHAPGCPGASPALQAVLTHEPIDSFARPDRSGHQALARLSVTADTLHAIGLDPSCANQVRFAAFEGWIGFAGEVALGKLDDATATAMAVVHTEALRTADDASPWGLPPDVASSELARHLIVLGKRALPYLRRLLDDLRELPYAGSETSAVAGLRRYRVADLAAGVIAVMIGVHYQDAKTPAERDRQLAELRARA